MDRRTKLRATYDLRAIQAQMTTVAAMNLRFSALKTIHEAGMSEEDALEVIRRLTTRDFYKSMPSDRDCHIWQDVYFADWCGMTLYVKFSRLENYYVLSFKESEDI